jgi:ATP-dependent 26S proteasome regulatory subunit
MATHGRSQARARMTACDGSCALVSRVRCSVIMAFSSLQHPDAFLRLGIQPPKGILLYGPPVSRAPRKRAFMCTMNSIADDVRACSSCLCSSGLLEDSDGEGARERKQSQLHRCEGSGALQQMGWRE